MRLENKQIGVLIALIFGFIMLFLPSTDKSKYSFDPSLLANEISESIDHVSPRELSEWIIEGKNDFQLIDIRSEDIYNKGAIKTAENIPLKKLLQKKTIDSELSSDKLILLYSTGNSHAHQAWLILKAAGMDAYVLEGGFNYWNKVILNPEAPQQSFESDDEILKYNAAVSVGQYFGGSSSTATGAESPKSSPKKKIRKKGKKKILDGC